MIIWAHLTTNHILLKFWSLYFIIKNEKEVHLMFYRYLYIKEFRLHWDKYFYFYFKEKHFVHLYIIYIEKEFPQKSLLNSSHSPLLLIALLVRYKNICVASLSYWQSLSQDRHYPYDFNRGSPKGCIKTMRMNMSFSTSISCRRYTEASNRQAIIVRGHFVSALEFELTNDPIRWINPRISLPDY